LPTDGTAELCLLASVVKAGAARRDMQSAEPKHAEQANKRTVQSELQMPLKFNEAPKPV